MTIGPHVDDGVSVARRLRECSAVPLIVLSVPDHQRDKIEPVDGSTRREW